MLHRVPEGGPVTYIFLGHANARSFLAYFNPDLVLRVGVSQPDGSLSMTPTNFDMTDNIDCDHALASEARSPEPNAVHKKGPRRLVLKACPSNRPETLQIQTIKRQALQRLNEAARDGTLATICERRMNNSQSTPASSHTACSSAPSSVQHYSNTPSSALILKKDWLDMILCGRKTWEIRSMRTTKRERVALALSGTSLLLGDVEIVDCIKLDAAAFNANMAKHGVSPHRHAEVVGDYKQIFAWEVARPRRYSSPVSYAKKQGPITFVNLEDQQAIFANVCFVESSGHETALPSSHEHVAAPQAAPSTATSSSSTVATRQQAVLEAEQRAQDEAQRGIGNVERAEAMAASSTSAASSKKEDVFGASRRKRLRENLFGAKEEASQSTQAPLQDP